MLQRLNTPLDEELYSGCGLWARSELEDMNDRFVAAVEAAFAAGSERREAAAATVRIGPRLNGKGNGKGVNGKGAAIERAFDSAWDLLVERKGELAAAEVVSFVQALCPGISATHVRLGLAQRVRERGVGW